MEEKKQNTEQAAELSVEQIFEQLDGLMEKLEAQDTSLEDAFRYYEAGVRLVRACSEKIDKVEKQIIVLQGGDDGNGDT